MSDGALEKESEFPAGTGTSMIDPGASVRGLKTGRVGTGKKRMLPPPVGARAICA
ncbi:MAG: hypothetical protein JXM70_05260 [Pirellulales bacterium]|nr:hypothetical protein [Pirellulales bacterium]